MRLLILIVLILTAPAISPGDEAPSRGAPNESSNIRVTWFARHLVCQHATVDQTHRTEVESFVSKHALQATPRILNALPRHL